MLNCSVRNTGYIIFTNDLDPEVDLVAVCSPDAFHVPYAKQILNAGKAGMVLKTSEAQRKI